MTATSVVALVAVCGCALPVPFGNSASTNELLAALTRHDTEKPLSPPPELVREPSPYPTAIGSAPPRQPLPLQQAAPATAMPLDRQKLVGRLPPVNPQPAGEEQEKSAAAVTSAASTPPIPPRASEQQPITLEVASADSVVSSMLKSAEKSWPTTAAGSVASSEPLANQPVNVKPPPPSAEPPKPEAPEPSAAAAAAPPQPTAPANAESPDELLPKLIAAIEKDIRERTDRKELDELPALQQKLRLLKLVADDVDDAVEQIEQLPAAEREAYKQMMFALTTWLSPDDAKRASLRNAKILRSLQEVNDRLSAVSKLDLKNLTFCEKVESFGWYTEFPRAEFTPKQQVILYVEVQNFAAEEKTATAFETELQGSYQIYDASGGLVDERQLPLDREVCRNFRRDYFLAYRIYLPSELPTGRYRLELTIEDLKARQDFKGKKQGEAMIEFSIK